MDYRICEGRVAIVTGGGRGLGRDYALALAAAGASVVVNDLGSARDGSGVGVGPAEAVVNEIAASGGQAVVNTDDVSSFVGAQALVTQAIETFGHLDVLVNNAGILRDRMLFSMSEDDWDDVVRVHLKGTFAPIHFAATYWRQRCKNGVKNDSRIINTTSISGLYANPGQGNYGAAKAGIASLTQIAAQEFLSRYGVTVNAVAPGALTRMTEDLLAPEVASKYAPHWVAPVVTWLASVRSADVTGQIIESSGLVFGVAEGWRRGPHTQDVPTNPYEVERILRGLLAESRPRTTFAEANDV